MLRWKKTKRHASSTSRKGVSGHPGKKTIIPWGVEGEKRRSSRRWHFQYDGRNPARKRKNGHCSEKKKRKGASYIMGKQFEG